VLGKLHLAHAIHIPFENLDILQAKPIRLDLDSLQSKLVLAQRGGYCFEQNTLFAAALEEIGFQVTRLSARVRYGATRLLPRTHMLLRVEADGESWLADVGFGGDGLLQPLPLSVGRENQQFAWSYRLIREGEPWVLQSLGKGLWQDLYAFTLEPQYDVDFELANYWTSTHPTSVFVKTLTVQQPTPKGRHILRGRQLTFMQSEIAGVQVVEDDVSLLKVLKEIFGLWFPPGTRFSAPAPNASK
jgi:N-hydroxyarylamine O-acetyltransferase